MIALQDCEDFLTHMIFNEKFPPINIIIKIEIVRNYMTANHT